ncbi:DUF805 domain-containing protein [uncultured Microbacterium sp.]|uniref:DUF805 domain-containing protein n=1 Tax=uncultured Microbacterium sp. TaxID=191216 RepID=UPI0026095AE8|nr:DUF805 domain-containing protein [uncultured Microbacterium sp.]
MSDQQPYEPPQPHQPTPTYQPPASAGAENSTDASPAAAVPAYPSAPASIPAPAPGFGAAPATPTAPTYPGAPQAFPGAQPTHPGAQPGYAAPQQAYAGAQPGYPAAHPGYQGHAAAGYGAPGYLGYVPAAPRGASHPDDLTLPLYGATFGQALSRFFKKYATFSGRASRSEYWFVQLFVVLVSAVAVVLGSILLGTSAAQEYNGGGSGVTAGIAVIIFIAMGMFSLAIIVPSLAISWRRLHDANFAGPFWFLSLTSAGALVVLVFTILPSNPQGERFDR